MSNSESQPNNEAKVNAHSILDRSAAVFENNWTKKNTAILVIHGIGDQKPLETLDEFGRGLIKMLRKSGHDLVLEHRTMKKSGSTEEVWFDNYVRIKNKEDTKYIDLFEYYWAAATEDKATFADTSKWLKNVAAGAKQFYKQTEQLGKSVGDKSWFFSSSSGRFYKSRYLFMLRLTSIFIPLIGLLYKGLLYLISLIPLVGNLLKKFLDGYFTEQAELAKNVINDVVIYNTTDAKSKFYRIRRRILGGSVKALRFLVEYGYSEGEREWDKGQVAREGDREWDKGQVAREKESEGYCEGDREWNKGQGTREKESEGDRVMPYEKVLLAGHSLGSQVAFDTMNRLNMLVNEGEIKGYDRSGKNLISGIAISSVLSGLITFGSPLDKIAFFLREQVESKEYLQLQIKNHFHGFKQRKWIKKEEGSLELESNIERRFDEILWKNYYDRKDYVSGALDYYMGLVNVDCQFKAGNFAFTHSDYWSCEEMYADIWRNFVE